MKSDKPLKEKIIKSIYIYETKKFTIDSVLKILFFAISVGIIIIFGEVITDIYTEGELGGVFGNFIRTGEYSITKTKEFISIIIRELPIWLLGFYIVGIVLGCILVVSLLRNRKLILQKARSIARYWLKI